MPQPYFLATLFSLAGFTTAASTWSAFGRSEFSVVSTMTTTQGAAGAQCSIQRSAALATVNGVSEELFLFQQSQREVGGSENLWVASIDGVSEPADNGSISGKCILAGPQNVGGEDVASNHLSAKCTDKHKYVCERSFNLEEHSQANRKEPGMAYIYVPSPQPWDTARRVCQSFGAGGDLATILSLDAEMFVASIVAQKWNDDSEMSDAPWIGCSDQWSVGANEVDSSEERTFEWARNGGECRTPSVPTRGLVAAAAKEVPHAGQSRCVTVDYDATCSGEADVNGCKQYNSTQCDVDRQSDVPSCPALCDACNAADSIPPPRSLAAKYDTASCRVAKPFICAVPVAGTGLVGGGGGDTGADDGAVTGVDKVLPAAGEQQQQTTQAQQYGSNRGGTTSTTSTTSTAVAGEMNAYPASLSSGVWQSTGLKAAVAVFAVFAVVGALSTLYFWKKLKATEQKLVQEVGANEEYVASNQRIDMEANPMHGNDPMLVMANGRRPAPRAPMPSPRRGASAAGVVENVTNGAPESPTMLKEINLNSEYVIADPDQPVRYETAKGGGIVYLVPDSRQPAVYDTAASVSDGSPGLTSAYQAVEYAVVDGSTDA